MAVEVVNDSDKKVSLERGVPIPPPSPTGAKASVYPWAEMRVGDSFLLQKKGGSGGPAKYRKLGWRFTTRKTPEGIRIWRVA